MKEQREKPLTYDEAQLIQQLRARGGPGSRFSGTMIENFREGWAVALFQRSIQKPHYFTRHGFDRAASLCGGDVPVRWLYGPGDHERCAHCSRLRQRILRKQASSSSDQGGIREHLPPPPRQSHPQGPSNLALP